MTAWGPSGVLGQLGPQEEAYLAGGGVFEELGALIFEFQQIFGHLVVAAFSEGTS